MWGEKGGRREYLSIFIFDFPLSLSLHLCLRVAFVFCFVSCLVWSRPLSLPRCPRLLVCPLLMLPRRCSKIVSKEEVVLCHPMLRAQPFGDGDGGLEDGVVPLIILHHHDCRRRLALLAASDSWRQSALILVRRWQRSHSCGPMSPRWLHASRANVVVFCQVLLLAFLTILFFSRPASLSWGPWVHVPSTRSDLLVNTLKQWLTVILLVHFRAPMLLSVAYHHRENNNRCKYLINSKTVDPHQITNITDSY